jgi:hypothetical protein
MSLFIPLSHKMHQLRFYCFESRDSTRDGETCGTVIACYECIARVLLTDTPGRFAMVQKRAWYNLHATSNQRRRLRRHLQMNGRERYLV